MTASPIDLAFELFRQKAASEEAVTVESISETTGWKTSTVRTYMSKQWASFLDEVDRGRFKVSTDFLSFPRDVFERINSQKFLVNKDPFKPILSRRTEELISKSREAALLAVQIYNNPLIEFRTPGFIVHMVIAFTSFFHALFEQDETEYFYREDDGSPRMLNGYPKLWDIRACIKAYFGDDNPPVRKNLELFVELRDMIEHRFAPAFDTSIASECQALLLNYERMLVEEFSPYYSLGTSVSIPLQISHISSQARINVQRELQKHDYTLLKEFVDQYRGSLDDEISGSPEYAFRVFLVQVPANRASSSDYTMEFVKYDETIGEEIEKFQRAITFIKTKTVQAVNPGRYKPGDVVKLIQEREPRFRMHEFIKAWKYYGVRPNGYSAEGCKTEFCQFDEVHKDYVYTEKWVDYLKTVVTDPDEYKKVLDFKL